MSNVRSKILGCILGQAIGDAMGSQTEFSSHKNVRDLGPTWRYNFPAFSDDTQMALAIIEGLLESPQPLVPGIPLSEQEDAVETTMQTIAKNFVSWDGGRWGTNDRSPGGTCMSGVHNIRHMGATEWKDTGALQGKGNGGVMRSSYVGCYLYRDPVAAYQFGALTSVPTHNNIESLIASGALSFLVAMAVNGCSFRYSMHRLMETIYKVPLLTYPPNSKTEEEMFAATRLTSAYFAGKDYTVAQFKSINGHDGKTVEALAAAIHANARHSNYGDIIIDLANHTGDSDSTAAIGGALAGARFGYGFIRSDWRKRVEKSEYLHNLAERVLARATMTDTVAAASRT